MSLTDISKEEKVQLVLEDGKLDCGPFVLKDKKKEKEKAQQPPARLTATKSI